MREGLLLIVCGPSGVGKTTLCGHLLDTHETLSLSVSYTTRAPRGSEKDAVAYHFVSPAKFERMIADDCFAEWANVHGNYYGTSTEAIETAWARGLDVLFDIDYQGAHQLKARYSDRAVPSLIMPPSMAELESRLRGRNTDDEAVVQKRLAAARHELAQYPAFDYLIVNDDLARAKAALDAIYHASRYRAVMQIPRVHALLNT